MAAGSGSAAMALGLCTSHRLDSWTGAPQGERGTSDMTQWVSWLPDTSGGNSSWKERERLRLGCGLMHRLVLSAQAYTWSLSQFHVIPGVTAVPA